MQRMRCVQRCFCLCFPFYPLTLPIIKLLPSLGGQVFLRSISKTTCVGAAFQQLSQAKQSSCSRVHVHPSVTGHLPLPLFSLHLSSHFFLARLLAVHPSTFFPFTYLSSSVTHIASGYSSFRWGQNSSGYLLASLITECCLPLTDFSSNSDTASIVGSGL